MNGETRESLKVVETLLINHARDCETCKEELPGGEHNDTGKPQWGQMVHHCKIAESIYEEHHIRDEENE